MEDIKPVRLTGGQVPFQLFIARTKLAGAVKKHGTAVNFVRQDQRQLVKWVQAHFQAAPGPSPPP